MGWTIRILSTLVAGAIVIGATAATGGAVDLNAAKQMFGELCIRCHGPQGFGDGPDGTTLSTKPRNFHDCAIMAKDSDDTVFKEVKGGSASIGRSNDMPSWGEALDDNEVRNLVAYLRTFCQQK